MAHYSKYPAYDSSTTAIENWPGITLSSITQKERKKIRWGLDEFATFQWRGIDAFETFGAFIINNKNSLKFYNGPTYSNEYTKPQFESAAGQLVGVTFSVQKIDFTIGVYWISEADYRQMIYWLHPYEINTLVFDFEPNYYYQVKLASVENGIRYIVGNEVIDTERNTEPRYYTELKLTFEIQGPAVAYSTSMYEWGDPEVLEDSDNKIVYVQELNKEYNEAPKSDIETPLIITSSIDLAQIKISSEDDVHLLYSAYAYYSENGEYTRLFEVELQNLTYGESDDNTSNVLTITYDSEKALMFLTQGDSKQSLLTRLSTLTSGDRIVDQMTVNQFRVPGIFDDLNFDIGNFQIQYTLYITDTGGEIDSSALSTTVSCRPRTNLI